MQPQPSAAPATAADGDHLVAVRRELDEVAERPLAEHPDVFDRVHSHLQQALADIENA